MWSFLRKPGCCKVHGWSKPRFLTPPTSGPHDPFPPFIMLTLFFLLISLFLLLLSLLVLLFEFPPLLTVNAFFPSQSYLLLFLSNDALAKLRDKGSLWALATGFSIFKTRVDVSNVHCTVICISPPPPTPSFPFDLCGWWKNMTAFYFFRRMHVHPLVSSFIRRKSVDYTNKLTILYCGRRAVVELRSLRKRTQVLTKDLYSCLAF